MSKNKTIIFLIGSIFLLTLSGRTFAVFGYDSFQECFLEELTECGGELTCARLSHNYCVEEVGDQTDETRPKTGVFSHGSNAECMKEEVMECGDTYQCKRAAPYYCKMYHPEKK